ncbi:hypothetical protein CBR_g52546 [Chara braunii]|uniref:Uncharacterized protein n=1 Tax=Chara braunii TaxID=69332 RepID=A0A388MAL9_CHABU|nr:hypothetical protein CBR_g52546 [Chara braunii]|eukprot:GBG91512.1 hypothetical protein CBR_g52546 [Chara braunii]
MAARREFVCSSAAAMALWVFLSLLCAFLSTEVHAIGCPANSSADSLRIVSEYMIHRPSDSFGPLFFDEQRNVLLFTVTNEVWRIPIMTNSSEMFVCNSSTQSWENARQYAVDVENGMIHVAATEGTKALLHSIDYNGLQIIKRNTQYVPYVNAFAGSAQCVLYLNTSKMLVTAFRESGIVIFNTADPAVPAASYFIDPSTYSYANISSCILDPGRNKMHFLAQNSSTMIRIEYDIGQNITKTTSFPAEVSVAQKTMGLVSPDNNRLFLANSNTSQFIQALPYEGSNATYFNLPGGYSFTAMAADHFRRRVYYFTNDPAAPIYMFHDYEQFPPTSPLRTLPLYYTSIQPLMTTYTTRNITVYQAYFAKNQDLAFFVTDPLDTSVAVDIMAVTTSSCPDSFGVCHQTSQGNCGCAPKADAAYPVFKAACNQATFDYTPRLDFPIEICPGNPVPTPPVVATPPSVPATAPTEPAAAVSTAPTEPAAAVSTAPTEPAAAVSTAPTEPAAAVSTAPTEPAAVTTAPTEPAAVSTAPTTTAPASTAA